MKHLIALSQKNKQNCVLYSIVQFENLLEKFNFWQVSLLDLWQWTQIKTNFVLWQSINDTCYIK